MKSPRQSAAHHRPRILLALSVAALLILMLLGGSILYVTVARPDVGYGLQDLLRKRTALELNETEAGGTEAVLLADIRAGTREEITWQNSLWLVNAAHPLSEDAELMLTEYKDTELLVDRSGVSALQELLQTAEEETGDRIYLMSSYRTREEQEAEYLADPQLAVPAGTSEHETGLALDLYVYQKAQREFITAKGGVWIQEHAHEYGWIIRYPVHRCGRVRVFRTYPGHRYISMTVPVWRGSGRSEKS